MKKQRLFAWMVAVMLLLTACGDRRQHDAIDDSVLSAWEGSYSVQKRKEAISEYQKKYIPVYVVNLESNTVSFQIDFEGTACGSVVLTPVNDAEKGAELNTIMDFTGEASVDGKTVTVDISWWFNATDSVRTYKLWSYLFWVKDAEGVQHYYYFRLDYTV